MKKILLLFSCVVLLTAFTCENEPLEGEFLTEAEVACLDAIDASAEAQANFNLATDDDFPALCSVLKTALEAQIEACGDANGFLQTRINDLGDCTVQIDEAACNMARVEKDAAETTFNDSTDDNYTETCNALKEALEAVLEQCGPDEAIQEQIDNLGNCLLTTSPVVEISVRAGTLLTEFDVVDVVEDGNILKVTGTTSATTNDYMVYFEVMAGETGVDIINSTFVITYTSEFFPSTQGFEDFTSDITENTSGVLKGTFSGTVTNADNADLSLTSGMIDITY